MGGVRTALYNYLFARKHGGDFLLRIEDTDQTRFVPGAEEYIRESLEWCGISPVESPWTGGPHAPYRQSERKAMYRAYANQLIASGHAYYAFDTAEDLERIREAAQQAGNANWQYNIITRGMMKNSLTLPEDDVQARLAAGDPYVIRLKLPRNEEIKFHDAIRGWVQVNTANMDDKVLFKSDGMPTYHLANVVDDHLMEITHVIRGEEWLPSAPLHVLLYRFFGWDMPVLAHLPLLLRPDGHGKLSKRDGDRLGFPVFPLNWNNAETGETASGYREAGFFPEAFINMLAFLGWNPGTEQEIFNLEELAQAFSLERVSKAGAKFDFDKTRWFNQQYLRAKSDGELAALARPLLEEQGISNVHQLERICELMKERATFVSDLLTEGAFFFHAPTTYDANLAAKKWNASAAGHARTVWALMRSAVASPADTEAIFKQYLADQGLGFGQLAPAIRLALTGGGSGPGLFDIMAILGEAEVDRRMQAAMEHLGA
jgi:glutamyl-tRNA synthetase